MRPPVLIARYFDRDPAGGMFAQMANVLRYTAAQHCATWTRSIEVMPSTGYVTATANPLHAANTEKLEAWVAAVDALEDGTRVLLIDADTAILRPLDDVWDRAFDVAYTVKAAPFRFNLGVMFLRVSRASRALLERWVAENRRLASDPNQATMLAWRQQYGGINQAAFGRLLEREAFGDVDLQGLPCREWNVEDSAWHRYKPGHGRILHCKSNLRLAVQGFMPVNPDIALVTEVWQQLARAAKQSATEAQIA